MDARELAAHIDQTLLKPTAGFSQASEWMDAAHDVGYAALCVAPFLTPLAAQKLAGTDTAVCTVCGFPLGYALTETKAEEAAHLVQLGAIEVDVVMNVAAFLGGEHDYVVDDVRAVVDAVARTSDRRGVVKVILETGYLDEDGVAEASRLAVAAGAGFVKTSTGFGPRGASIADVRIMRETVGPDVGVKAAGGIRDLETALAMLEAGADRLGTSSGAEIVAALAHRE